MGDFSPRGHSAVPGNVLWLGTPRGWRICCWHLGSRKRFCSHGTVPTPMGSPVQSINSASLQKPGGYKSMKKINNSIEKGTKDGER